MQPRTPTQPPPEWVHPISRQAVRHSSPLLSPTPTSPTAVGRRLRLLLRRPGPLLRCHLVSKASLASRDALYLFLVHSEWLRVMAVAMTSSSVEEARQMQLNATKSTQQRSVLSCDPQPWLVMNIVSTMTQSSQGCLVLDVYTLVHILCFYGTHEPTFCDQTADL